MTKKVLIGICTYKRNFLLENCLKELEKINIPYDTMLEIVVADNSEQEEAKELVEKIGKNYLFKLNYFSEKKHSIAAVRNKILRESLNLTADYVAFIDDDEYPDKNWLIELCKTIDKYECDVVSGDVTQIFDKNISKSIKENYLFKNKKNRKTGDIRQTACSGNVIFSTKLIKEKDLYFDENYGLMTGEDLNYFEKANDLGYKIVWCEEAIVFEIVEKKRQNLKYILARNFNNGFLKIFNQKKKNKNIFILIFKILINLLVFSILLLLSIFTGRKNFYNVLGKLFFTYGEFYSILRKVPIEHYQRKNNDERKD